MTRIPATIRRPTRPASAARPPVSSGRQRLFTRRGGLARPVADFTRSLAVMVSARLPLTDGLETAQRQSSDTRLSEAIRDVLKHVRRGLSLADSMKRHPVVFSGFYCQMVRVGEAAGLLDDVLLQLATYLEKTEELKRKVRLALAYPAVVLSVALGAVVFLLAVVVPTFADMFADFGAELPAPTRAVIALSAFIRSWYWLIAGSGLAAWIGIRQGLGTQRGRNLWDRARLRTPLLGKLYLHSLTARFCRTLGTLIQSGVPLTDALSITADASGNDVVAEAVREMRRRVIRGSRLASQSPGRTVFPPMVVQMITVGEETARLSEMLLHSATYYEGQVDGAVNSLTSFIEPVLIVLLGIVVGAILISIYLPMFELSQVVQ